MEIKWYNRIIVRISSLLLILTALSLTVFYVYGSSSAQNYLQAEMERFAGAATERLATYLSEPLAKSDRVQIEAIVLAELRDEWVASIVVRNIDQSVLLALEKAADGTTIETRGTGRQGLPTKKARIIHENRVLGSIELSVRPSYIASPLQESVRNLSLLTVGLNLCIFLALYLALRMILVAPMTELTRATENISLGRLEATIANHSKNELGQLTAAIERLRVSMRIAMKRLASSKKGPAGVDAAEWKDVILENKHFGFEFLALRILVGRLSLNYRNDPTQETMRRCVQQLMEFFQNERNPLAQKDLTKIFGGVAI